MHKIYADHEKEAVRREAELRDMQVGGQAAREQELYERVTCPDESYVLPQLKLERLAEELNQLEEELRALEKTEIPSQIDDENDSINHIREIEFLRTEMAKILNSDAFDSLEGKSKI